MRYLPQAPRNTTPSRGIVPLLIALACASCGEKPVRVEEGGAPTQMPQGHPEISAEPLFAGAVVFEMDLKEVDSGYLFLNIRPEVHAPPLLSKRYEIATDTTRTENGYQQIVFDLSARDSMMGPVEIPEKVVLEAWYDPDGMVETKEGVSRKPMTVHRGDLSLEVRLDGKRKAGPGPAKRPSGV
ncbi:MAG: hypothetical protein QF903_05570 [Planctomycetota bacterium]|jgi:hypothetical protein|nr:hypothetical protein [Planctomycetota bacterium]MDP6988928.1 hypothetical protein [Planctomycetota bacterium]